MKTPGSGPCIPGSLLGLSSGALVVVVVGGAVVVVLITGGTAGFTAGGGRAVGGWCTMGDRGVVDGAADNVQIIELLIMSISRVLRK